MLLPLKELLNAWSKRREKRMWLLMFLKISQQKNLVPMLSFSSDLTNKDNRNTISLRCNRTIRGRCNMICWIGNISLVSFLRKIQELMKRMKKTGYWNRMKALHCLSPKRSKISVKAQMINLPKSNNTT